MGSQNSPIALNKSSVEWLIFNHQNTPNAHPPHCALACRRDSGHAGGLGQRRAPKWQKHAGASRRFPRKRCSSAALRHARRQRHLGRCQKRPRRVHQWLAGPGHARRGATRTRIVLAHQSRRGPRARTRSLFTHRIGRCALAARHCRLAGRAHGGALALAAVKRRAGRRAQLEPSGCAF